MEERKESALLFLKALFLPEKLSNTPPPPPPSVTYNDGEQVSEASTEPIASVLEAEVFCWSGLNSIITLQVGWYWGKAWRRDGELKYEVVRMVEGKGNGHSPRRLRNTLAWDQCRMSCTGTSFLRKKERKKESCSKIGLSSLGKVRFFPNSH